MGQKKYKNVLTRRNERMVPKKKKRIHVVPFWGENGEKQKKVACILVTRCKSWCHFPIFLFAHHKGHYWHDFGCIVSILDIGRCLTKNSQVFEMEKCRAEKNWAYFYKIKELKNWGSNKGNCKNYSPKPIFLPERHEPKNNMFEYFFLSKLIVELSR